jgi:hypothetical protein
MNVELRISNGRKTSTLDISSSTFCDSKVCDKDIKDGILKTRSNITGPC